ncbi:DUF2939 domain-containing protein [Mitsuaria sp. GD03876]|uniref:DUF2939 domain-containing protein n=1 Tax=Mitsuaria sp. GD03876 TaxID=2975399 RepID=UPI002449FC92|nr:DUF2939 domain-containing protein [Mitsuaria sp. GD03876]MDH0864881.1 DUF2939 domain-containing protein [Mitsuaria sp. GD03876]
MASKSLKVGAIAVLLGVAAYWYWSPFLAIHQLRAAAKAGDADAFNDHVDYPRLRESLKGQFSAAIGDRMADRAPKSDAGRAGAVLGSMFAVAMTDRMVDALVRPEAVMRIMQEGKLMPKRGSRRAPDGEDQDGEEPRGGSDANRADGRDPIWSTERKSVDKLVLYARGANQPEDRRTGLVLERRGFASWQLTEIRLPSL